MKNQVPTIINKNTGQTSAIGLKEFIQENIFLAVIDRVILEAT